ncbi:hypothetical protein AB0I28_11850 [Phytomonospora sp. NPDC050363]|uniref:hypothetical protein n=1 Tax=Phytomonospora sp. NPDC050363 TaxID=3155642 RepID=UPI00340FD715
MAADVAAAQSDIVGFVGGVLALALVTTAILIAFRHRRRTADADGDPGVPGSRRTPVPDGGEALPPPPFPETGMTAPITAPGRLQSPKVDPPATPRVMGLD